MPTDRADTTDIPGRGETDRPAWPPRSTLLVLDLVAVLLFATVGRRSHAEGISAAGVLDTAWPFLAGAATGWGAARAWRRPTSLASGAGVWATTHVLGMALRRATGDGTAAPFVVVAALVLAALFLGWRALAHVARSRAERP
jgi:hypothetical protein